MRLACLLFPVSGALGLVYELLWMRELSLLFGATAPAAAVTLAAYFLGMGIGGWFWGRRAQLLQSPLRSYGYMELGVAVSASLCLAIPPLYRLIYPLVYEHLAASAGALLAVKFLLSFVALLPAAFLIGGTLPVIHQVYARAGQGGRGAPMLYALNTTGAVAGVLLTGLWLPSTWGYRATYLAAVTASALVGLVACVACGATGCRQALPENPNAPGKALEAQGLAFLSGLILVALEVLWTRMFAQVLQNSVQTFALILAVCVLGLALGALLASRMGKESDVDARLFFALNLSALLVAATPQVFVWATEGLRYVGQGLGWGDYLMSAAGLIAAVLGPALVSLGLVFPLLLYAAGRSSSDDMGRLLLINSLGAACGALAAGFLLLNLLGLWSSIRFLATLYLLCLLLAPRFRPFAQGWRRALTALGILLLVTLLDSGRLPLVRVDPLNEGESLLRAWEDQSGVVAVIRHGDHLKIKQDNHYTLGGSGSAQEEALQGSLAVLLHPGAEAVYALGLGTGISAGATLRHPVRHLEVTELLPYAIEAARLYFAPFHFGLFDDPRARVLQEDGRNHLAATRATYDVIVGDLFVPWQAGTGSLYAVEHFRAVKSRLRDGGLFLQWLPAYQVSMTEFAIIARTLLEVFPQVSVWRGEIATRTPVLGFLAQARAAPLPADARLFSGEADAEELGGARLLAHYVGRLQKERFSHVPINSDDHAAIEFGAPVTQRRQKLGESQWLTGMPLIEFLTEIRNSSGQADDPYLSALPAPLRRLPEAGLCQFRAQVEKQEGYLTAAEGSQACADTIFRGLALAGYR